MTFFTKKHFIKQCLEKNEAMRDNDNLLIKEVVMSIEGENLETLSAKELLENLSQGKYGSLESIRRSRQKWQEMVETLRGEKWLSRQVFSGSVAEQLTFWDLLNE